jgi:hypothetical protein
VSLKLEGGYSAMDSWPEKTRNVFWGERWKGIYIINNPKTKVKGPWPHLVGAGGINGATIPEVYSKEK